MRSLIYAINLSLDGVCEHTKFMPNLDTFEYFTDLVRGADTFVYGRKTYELMVPYWPDIAKNPTGDKVENDFAQAFISVNKMVVISRSLNSVEGGNTEIVRENIQDTILRLKQEEGKYILTGGIDIPSQLSELGLIDEYHFVVHPIVVGEGRRLLEGISTLPLKLIGSNIFKSGSVVLRYIKLA